MAINQTLAQAIINQRAPDILGEFRRGQQIAREGKERVRQEEVRTLAGASLSAGGGKDLEALKALDPIVALSIGEAINAQSAADINEMIRDAGITKRMLEAGNSQGALTFVQQRFNTLQHQGRNTEQTKRIRDLLANGQGDQALQELTAFDGALTQASAQTTAAKNFAQWQAMPEGAEKEAFAKAIGISGVPASDQFSAKTTQIGGLTVQSTKQGDVIVRDAQNNIITGPEAEAAVRAANEEEAALQGRRAQLRKEGTATGDREQTLINRGIAAAESTATTRRAIELLNSVKTGGIQNAALRAKQFFGVEGADEGELSFNLGKNVLGQLKEVFGAQFTEKEGERLDRIEANFGRSPEANLRLLNQALRMSERTAARARKLAEQKGDTNAVADIDDLLSFTLALDENPKEPPPISAEQSIIEVDF